MPLLPILRLLRARAFFFFFDGSVVWEGTDCQSCPGLRELLRYRVIFFKFIILKNLYC